jgi:FkbM family methyltransferase
MRATGRFLEYDLLADARRFLMPRDVVVDVGAHVGNHTVFFAAICNCFVSAFEPDEQNYGMLRQTVMLNALEGQVDLHRAAVSSERGAGNMVDGPRATASTRRLSVTPDGVVPVVRLDDIARPGPVRVLKIDVEGHELQVLQGAAELIRQDRPRIYVECLDEKHFSMIARYLAGLEYRATACFADSPTFGFSPGGQNEFVTDSDQDFGAAAIHQYAVRMRRLSELRERVATAKAAQRREADRAAKALAAQEREAKRAAEAVAAQRKLAKDLRKIKKSATYRMARVASFPARKIRRLWRSILHP